MTTAVAVEIRCQLLALHADGRATVQPASGPWGSVAPSKRPSFELKADPERNRRWMAQTFDSGSAGLPNVTVTAEDVIAMTGLPQ